MRLALHIARLGTSSYTIAYTATHEGLLRFTASTVMVPLRDDGSGSRPLTPGERGYLEGFLQRPDPAVPTVGVGEGAERADGT